VGSSVSYLFKKDATVADFIVSYYFTAEVTLFLNLAPPEYLRKQTSQLKSTLPSMSALCKCNNDSEIIQIVGNEPFKLLRWILFSNRSYLITLPNELKLHQFPNCIQIITLISTTMAEIEFQRRKKQYGRCFFWHGSWGERWYAI
jgi:hypothetical protein